jgi:general L-amino acid transport system permease protein
MIWRASRRARVGQWLLLAVIVAIGWLLAANAASHLARRNVPFGFGFLGNPTNFAIPFHLIAWSTTDTYGRALLVCLLNTLLVSVIGIVVATALGLLVGVMRLSGNWLVRNIALWVIELVRNTPQLIQIIFWYVAVLQTLPGPRQSLVFPGGILLNVRGLYLPRLEFGLHGARDAWLALLTVLAIPLIWRVRIGAMRVGWRALVLLIAAGGLLRGGIAHVDRPALVGFNIAGGLTVPPELVALSAGLAIYSAGFIAEIVRGSIEAVPKGQWEAATSLGLKPRPVLALVVLPQALRIMVPQLTSQYLNLIKSSSLGPAVAYPELFQIYLGTVLNQTGREIETIVIVMTIFLSISLLTSAFLNWYNRRVALIER